MHSTSGSCRVRVIQIMKAVFWIWDKILWWINLSYGEIIRPLKPGWKVSAVFVVHLVLAAAIMGPIGVRTSTMGLGILCWLLSAFYIIWNLCLDEYGISIWQPLRKKIVYLEEQAEFIAADTLCNQAKKFALHNIRLMIPGIFTILGLVTWIGILMITR